MTAHRHAGGLKKKSNLWVGSQRHRHFVGFFNVPVQTPTRGQTFYGDSEKPHHFSHFLRHGWEYVPDSKWKLGQRWALSCNFHWATVGWRCKTISTLLIQKMLAQHVVQTLAQHVVPTLAHHVV